MGIAEERQRPPSVLKAELGPQPRKAVKMLGRGLVVHGSGGANWRSGLKVDSAKPPQRNRPKIGNGDPTMIQIARKTVAKMKMPRRDASGTSDRAAPTTQASITVRETARSIETTAGQPQVPVRVL